jgi:2-polyprenyl-6-methoxyphenol hydroxylase-like FAD-dependent oxidoreductase
MVGKGHQMTDVIVVGAGPTGLWLAGELALAGVAVTVLERNEERNPHSKAMGVHARTVEVLAMRGAQEPFLAAGRPLDNWHWGLTRSRLDLRALDTPYPFMLAIPQARTEALLEDRALNLGAVIKRGHRVTGLRESGDEVTVDIDGRLMAAAYVVGCDGPGSTVRQKAGIDFDGTDATVVGLVADVVLDDPPPPGFSHVSERGAVLVAPAPGGLFRIGGYDPLHQDADVALDSAGVRRFLIRTTSRDFGIRETIWASRFGNATRQAHVYRSGRVLLAGDAAHIHFPTGGVGLNTGIQDAMNLGWKLAAVVRDRAPQRLLDTYHSERHPVATAVGADTQAQTALLTAITPEGLALRETMAALIAAPSAINRVLAERVTALDVAYPPADSDAHPLVGRRAPASEKLFGAMHAGEPVVVSGDLPGRGWSDAQAALVRPDGYIGWAATATSAEQEAEALLSLLS